MTKAQPIKRVSEFPQEPVSYFKEITPIIAKEMLTRNHKNRHLIEHVVEKYARAILENEWKMNGQPICFNKNGDLMNGQHRLSAIIKANKSIIFLIVEGLNPDVFDTIDIGRGRAVSDLLSIKGYKNTAMLAAVAKTIYIYNYKKSKRWAADHTKFVSNEKIFQIINESPAIQDSIEIILKLGVGRLSSGSIAASLHYIVSNKYPIEGGDFFLQLGCGVDLKENSPILHLRNFLLKARIERKPIGREEFMALLINAWNKFKNKQDFSPKDLKYVSDTFPELQL